MPREIIQVECYGDTLSIEYTGSVYRSLTTGATYSYKWECIAAEVRSYLAACGDSETADTITAEYCRENFPTM